MELVSTLSSTVHPGSAAAAGTVNIRCVWRSWSEMIWSCSRSSPGPQPLPSSGSTNGAQFSLEDLKKRANSEVQRAWLWSALYTALVLLGDLYILMPFLLYHTSCRFITNVICPNVQIIQMRETTVHLGTDHNRNVDFNRLTPDLLWPLMSS